MALVRAFFVRDDAFTGWHTSRQPIERRQSSRKEEGKMIATLEQPQTTVSANRQSIVASLEGVNKNYGDIRALRGVDFHVSAGQVVALLGPNGAGKTTAVK